MNKNISVWRGNSTPPTDYHLWIKLDGSIYLKLNDNWKELLPNNFSEIYESLKADVESNELTLNQLQLTLDAFFKDADVSLNAIDTLKELQTYISEHGTEVSALLKLVNENTEKLKNFSGNFAKVATTGSYNDLIDTPDLISVVQDIGKSTTSVMSQKAVTDALLKKYDAELVKDDITQWDTTTSDDYVGSSAVFGAVVQKYANEQLWDALSDKANKSELTKYAKTTDIPTKVSAFENDKGYLTEHQSLESYYTKTEVDSKLENLSFDYYTIEEIEEMFLNADETSLQELKSRLAAL